MLGIDINGSDQPVFDVNDLIGLVGNTTFVGYHDNGLMLFFVQLLEKCHHFHARLRVQSARWLVGKDNFWLGDEGTRNGNALLLSAAHLVGIVLGPLQKAQSL